VQAEIYPEVPAVRSGEYRFPAPERVAKGMAYIGTRPTIDGMSRKIEINLLDFKDDIYKKTLRVKFLKFIRQDQWFESIEAMRQQMKADEMEIRRYFGE